MNALFCDVESRAFWSWGHCSLDEPRCSHNVRDSVIAMCLLRYSRRRYYLIQRQNRSIVRSKCSMVVRLALFVPLMRATVAGIVVEHSMFMSPCFFRVWLHLFFLSVCCCCLVGLDVCFGQIGGAYRNLQATGARHDARGICMHDAWAS